MDTKEFTNSFLSQLVPGQIATVLLDMLPDTITYMKDIQSRFVHVNVAFVKSLQIPKDQVIGKTDLEIFNNELATTYVRDDAKVMSTGTPMVEKPELVTYRPGLVRWYVTSKIPLHNRNGEIIGMAGLTRPSAVHRQHSTHGPMGSVSKAVEYIYDHVHEMLNVDNLARMCGLSTSSLERHFKKHLGYSPGRFITQVKISTACEYLGDPSFTVAEVGHKLGYSDAVVFSRVFKREMRISPSKYRKSLKMEDDSE